MPLVLGKRICHPIFLLRAWLSLSLFLVGAMAWAGTNTLPWRWSNPSPFGANAADLAFQTNRVYVAVCDHGEIFVSDDFSNWRRRSPGVTNSLRAVTYFGEQIVVAGSGGLILAATGENFIPTYLGTSSSLEGIAASTTMVVAVGDRGTIYTSTSATNWISIAPPFTNWLRSVAFGNGVFAAVGENGMAATSTDGNHWQVHPIAGFSLALNRVAWNGSGFTAVGQAGSAVMSDSTGNNWSPTKSTGGTGDLYALAINTGSASAGIELAAGVSEVHIGASSRGGFAWSTETSTARPAPAPLLTYLSALWDGNQFILAAEGGVFVTGQRPDPTSGFSWSYPTTNLYGNVWDLATATVLQTNVLPFLATNQLQYQTNIAFTTNYFAAADNAGLASSGDGASWPISFAPTSATGQNYLGIAAGSGVLVGVGTGGILSISPNSYTPVVTTNLLTNGAVVFRAVLTNYHSTLGLAWYDANSHVNTDLQGISYASGLFVASGDAGTILTSTNGTNWTKRTSGVTNFLSSTCGWSNEWFAVGNAGLILGSKNGSTWKTYARPTTNWLWRIRLVQDQLFAMGQNGSLFLSTNGTNWQDIPTGTTSWLSHLCWAAGTYYLAGDDGVVLTSTNATSWQQTIPAFSSSIYALASINGQLVAAGSSGAILRAQVVPFSTPIQLIAWPHQSAEDLFVLGGQLDQQFQVIHSTNLIDWIGSQTLEIIDPGGTLIWLDPAPRDTNRQFFSAQLLP